MAHRPAYDPWLQGSSTNLTRDNRLDPVWVRDLVEKELIEAIGVAPGSSGSTSLCLLSDIGDFLLRLQQKMASMAGRLINSPHITTYIRDTIREAEAVYGYSDTALIEYLDQRYKYLE